VGQDDVWPVLAHGVKHALATLALEAFIFDPGDDITRGPLDLV